MKMAGRKFETYIVGGMNVNGGGDVGKWRI